jgi:hypothetical protein
MTYRLTRIHRGKVRERAAMTSMSLDYLAASFELHLRAEGKSAKTVRI